MPVQDYGNSDPDKDIHCCERRNNSDGREGKVSKYRAETDST